MRTVKVVESVDIQAPLEEVFDIILNIERRLQLSPLWGNSEIDPPSPDYPNAGSSYHVRVVRGEPSEYDAIVSEYVPHRKFAYTLTSPRVEAAAWIVQEVTQGTRLLYEEQFRVEEERAEEMMTEVRRVVHQWLTNMKQYAELRDGRARRLLRWVLDHWVLKLRAEQRRVIVMLLALQVIMFITFVMAAAGFGIMRLIIR